MSKVLPILFNTDMVRAILDGRKTVTRRLVKHDVDAILNSPYHKEHPEVEDKQIISKLCLPPYQPGDILYVRETWVKVNSVPVQYGYRVDNNYLVPRWHPSIHMPKEAARIWLKVKDVRVERLQEITEEHAQKEGCQGTFVGDGSCMGSGWDVSPVDEFSKLWDSTIKKSDLDRYGWDANPWVWVIELERCEKPED